MGHPMTLRCASQPKLGCGCSQLCKFHLLMSCSSVGIAWIWYDCGCSDVCRHVLIALCWCKTLLLPPNTALDRLNLT